MPSIGKDLSKIRAHLGLSIDDIQNATKIPVSTLKLIENDTIFSRQHEGKTYIRSFIRSYGRALKIDDSVMITALDQHESGNYNDLLIQQFPDLTPPSIADSPPEAPDIPDEPDAGPLFDKEKKADTKRAAVPGPEETAKSESAEPEKPAKTGPEGNKTAVPPKPSKETAGDKKPGTPPQKEKNKQAKNAEKDDSNVQNVDWARMNTRFTDTRKQTSSWLIGILILLIVGGATAYALYHFGYLDTDSLPFEDQTIQPADEAVQNNLSLDLNSPTEPETGSMAEEVNAELDDVLHLTVYAAYDRLDPVRVWSDLKPRLDPYWYEQGTALQFEFTDTIRIRGPYNNMILFLNGHRIDNFYENYFQTEENVVELTRDIFTDDSKWAASIQFELPEGVAEPDSVALRPSF